MLVCDRMIFLGCFVSGRLGLGVGYALGLLLGLCGTFYAVLPSLFLRFLL